MWVIIVAGGVGSRMKGNVPKQFLEICGKPILMHSLLAFTNFCEGARLIVALPPSQFEKWHKLCEIHNFNLPHTVVEGGETRFHSVKNALILLPDNGYVAIHDGVRPLVSKQTILNCFRNAFIHECAVPAVPVNDSVREITGVKSKVLDRSKLCLIQTPQVFDIAKLKKAYNRDYSPEFTDDAAVYESSGNPIFLCEGNVENIKITTPSDLIVAEAFIRKGN